MIFIIVNGYPESGKDEFIRIANEHFDIYYHSTIDSSKKIAKMLGWDGAKDDRSRAMLSDLKKWYVKYFDAPFKEIEKSVLESNSIGIDFAVTVSREGGEIKRFKEWGESVGIPTYYIFIRRDGTDRFYGNKSDDCVMDVIEPDIIVNNNGTLSDLQANSIKILTDIQNKYK